MCWFSKKEKRIEIGKGEIDDIIKMKGSTFRIAGRHNGKVVLICLESVDPRLKVGTKVVAKNEAMVEKLPKYQDTTKLSLVTPKP